MTRFCRTPRRPRDLCAGALLWLAASALPALAETVTVMAAASLRGALDEVAALYAAETGDRVNRAYAGSSALARQIQQGAPAQVFISANADWMDVLDAAGLLAPGTRADLLTNRLVLIAAPGTDMQLAPREGADLAGALGAGRLAMALVDAVPAGIYGKAALVSLGLWEQVAGRLAQTSDVQAALRLVALGEAPMGIVYATDSAAAPEVRVLGAFPEDSHPPIRYPAAILAEGDSAGARAFLAYLHGAAAGEVFRRHGFGLPGDGG